MEIKRRIKLRAATAKSKLLGDGHFVSYTHKKDGGILRALLSDPSSRETGMGLANLSLLPEQLLEEKQ